MKLTKYLIAFILVFSASIGIVYAAQNARVKSADVEWTFVGKDQEKLLIDTIKSSKSTLDIAIYSLTDPDIVAAIKDAKKRKVNVRIITDKVQAAGKSQTEALKILGSAGIPIKVNSHSGLMHIKMTIADKKIGTTGSFNYSQAASEQNDEILMVIRTADVAKNFSAQFDKMWADTKRFKSVEYKIAQSTTPTTPPASSNVVYANCSAVKAAGKAPIRKGDPGYSTKLDKDGDGIACET
ncbi:phospholipase D-like domain-containing protein [Paenibacillus lupini]|uniref:phospholipase D-like domain-containing protein n=1 Tax=Paenibacillus lupini TaxID=1450204 RepID=UPI00141E90D4|nr:phospholipase D-like domain-containing protein [Paenibacillus lupini]NIK24209.1 phosphatidylserine/phosphatidylglycerophosphate/cardiolipin synthase-like enzyme [Paenibacillus lupini]